MGDIQAVLGGKSRLRKTQQINCVQDICFALPVQPYKAVEFGGKLQTRLAYIAIVEYVKRRDPHLLW